MSIAGRSPHPSLNPGTAPQGDADAACAGLPAGADASDGSPARHHADTGREPAVQRPSPSRPLPPSPLATTRLLPGDGLGFQMIRREADGGAFPLFISRSPVAFAGPPSLSSMTDGPADAAVLPATAATDVTADKPDARRRLRGKTAHHHHHQPKAGHQRKHRHYNSRVECHACGRGETPEWRCGPDGPGTLCNVCGLVFAKQQRRRSGG